MSADAPEMSNLRARFTERETDLDAGASKAPATLESPFAARAQEGLPAAQSRKFLMEIADALSPASFWTPEYICLSAWIEHAPFAFWICEALRPRRLVELGTHYGYSYFSFCQVIDRLGLGTIAYAIDTWKGDEHSGFYDETVFESVAARNRDKYRAFSTLIRSTFADALDYFEDGSIDLLHIDGRHLYSDVRNDFVTWRPKLTADAVVLFHDTNVREREFGVWKFFKEVGVRLPSFQFFHGNGLGVLVPGDCIPEPLQPLFRASSRDADQIRTVYSALGSALTTRQASDAAVAELRAGTEKHAATAAALRADIEQRAATEAALRAEIDQRAATEAALRAQIEQRKATEAALRDEIETRAQTEAALRAALGQAEREMHDRQARTETAEAEVAAVRETLKTTDRLLQEHAATAEALRTELKVSRGKLLEAERLGQQSDATTADLEGQITSLEGELAAAREVGRAALEALRCDTMLQCSPRRPATQRSGHRYCGALVSA
jgi:Methyltransferase domain